MLRSLPENYKIHTEEKLNEKHEEVLKSERLIDLLDEELNSFEKRVSRIFNNKTINEKEKKYKEIYKLFFDDFYKRLKNKSPKKDEKIKAESGQWVQSALERMSIIGIPIHLVVGSGATIMPGNSEDPPHVLEEKQKTKIIFNKEIKGRIVGALAVRDYVYETHKKNENTLLLSNGFIDLNYKVDLIQIENPSQEEEKTIFCQIKAGTKTKEEIDEICREHQDYFDFLVYADNKSNKNKEERLKEVMEDKIKAMQKQDSIVSGLEEFLLDIDFNPEEEGEYKRWVKEFSQKSGLDSNLIWYVLKQISEPEPENEIEEDSEIFPETLYLINLAKEVKIEEGAYVDNLDFFDSGLLDLGLRQHIYSRVVCNGEIVSQVKLKSPNKS